MLDSRKGRAGLCAALLTTTMLTAAPQAFAQSSTVEELVVTAQKREENLQNVALSIQAIGNEKLEQLQVNSFDDFAKFLPSVTYKTAGPGFTSIYMRGVASGDNGNHSGPVPSVGFYLDEQPVTTIQGPLDIHMYDIARVESLSGPQGTLYGASSQSGTIRIITNKPKLGVFEGAMDAEVNGVDHGGIGYNVEGFVNVPLMDNAAIRLIGWAQHDAGYIDNVLGSRTYPTWGGTDTNEDVAKDNYNDVDTYGFRAALKVDLNENWTITPTVMAQDQKSGGSFAYDPRVGDLQVIHFNPESAHDRWIQGALTIEGKIGSFDVVYAGAGLKRRTEAEQDYSDYSFAYDALPRYEYYIYDNNYNYINPSQFIRQDDHFTKQSHEFRISSPADRRFRFVAGAFYQKQTHDIQQRYMINNLLDVWEVPGWDDTIWLTKQIRTDIDEAVFGEASFDLTEKLTVTGGIRLFRADNSLVGFFGYNNPGFSSNPDYACQGPAVVDGSPCTNLDKNVTESGQTYKLNATYQLTPDKMIYATYSTGYRPPGINRRGSIPPYAADYLTNYEAGWKTMWLDGLLRWNGAVYFDKWSDFQFSYLGPNGLTNVNNAGSAEMKGIETDITLRPMDGLTVNGAAAYTDAKTTAPYCRDPFGDPLCLSPAAPAGQELPGTPKFKSSLTARYDFPMGDYDAYVQTSLTYQSAVWGDLRTYERTLLGRLPAYQTVDVSAGVSRDNWSVDVYLKNAFDERGEIGRSTQCAIATCADPYLLASPGAFGQSYVTPIRPRTLGLRIGRKF